MDWAGEMNCSLTATPVVAPNMGICQGPGIGGAFPGEGTGGEGVQSFPWRSQAMGRWAGPTTSTASDAQRPRLHLKAPGRLTYGPLDSLTGPLDRLMS